MFFMFVNWDDDIFIYIPNICGKKLIQMFQSTNQNMFHLIFLVRLIAAPAKARAAPTWDVRDELTSTPMAKTPQAKMCEVQLTEESVPGGSSHLVSR